MNVRQKSHVNKNVIIFSELTLARVTLVTKKSTEAVHNQVNVQVCHYNTHQPFLCGISSLAH